MNESSCEAGSVESTKSSEIGISIGGGSLSRTSSKDCEAGDGATVKTISEALCARNLANKEWLNSLKLWSKVRQSSRGLATTLF